MKVFQILFTFLVAFTSVNAVRQCAKLFNSGSEPRIECLCNSTYCDEFPPLGNLNNDQAAVYKSSISGKRFEKSVLSFGNSFEQERAQTIQATFDSGKTYQTMTGFGAAFTDACGINLDQLSEKTRDNFIEAYFGSSGIGYSLGRVPIASTDFSTHPYSYNDHDGDFNMDNFALTFEDHQYKIPYIKNALSKNKKLQLFSTPWAAPGWMKTNNNMVGHGELKGDVGGQYYQAFALYQYKFFEAYQKEGINFWGLTILNEPFSNGGWQIMSMTAEQERDFIKKNLGPLFKSKDLTKNLKVMIHDDQRPVMLDFVNTVLGDKDAAKYVDGMAVHYYEDLGTDPHILTDVHNAHSDKFILATEACTGWNADGMHGDWQRALIYSYDIITDIENWATGWVDWNICLDTTGGPTWINNFVDAPITVTKTGNDEFYKQPMYYALGHFSKFVQPGAKRVDLTTNNGVSGDYLKYLGFNGDNKNVAVFDNRQSSDTYNIELKDKKTGKVVKFDMEPRSYATVVWNA
uniref:Glucosylceramidase n=1 Tax=Panagrellus redivivus TaxID=6233 RepID=A0A7E4UUW6_PANRE